MSRDRQMNVRVSDEQLAIFQRAANEAGLPLGSWVIVALLHVAGESALYDQLSRVKPAQKRSKKS